MFLLLFLLAVVALLVVGEAEDEGVAAQEHEVGGVGVGDLLAVGGVDLSNMADYAKVGVCGFGIGGNIIDKKMLEKGDYQGITALADRYVSTIRNLYTI